MKVIIGMIFYFEYGIFKVVEVIFYFAMPSAGEAPILESNVSRYRQMMTNSPTKVDDKKYLLDLGFGLIIVIAITVFVLGFIEL